ncbi:MAG TPA: hypothetical protein ENI95_05705, partial [Chloroflexi bacterium]|nr:hypothetical protein [Chloroflexota bacterium]
MASAAELERLYREGVAAIRAGDSATGRQKLMQVIRQDEFHEQAWLWLSAVVETDEERIICLENVLTINPANEAARRGLEKLGASPPSPDTPDREVAARQDSAAPAHASPRAVDAELHARLAGVPPSEVPAEQPDDQGDEAWRAALLEAEGVTSEATLVPSAEPRPRRTLLDLFTVWADMLILNVYGEFQDEI